MKTYVRFIMLFAMLICAGSVHADLVAIALPSSVAFTVTDVTQSTTGSPNPFVINFSGLAIPNIQKFTISVRANAANFTPPSGAGIPASNVSWTTSGILNGTGFSGTLSSSAYTVIYQSNLLVTLGHINVTWYLAAPGAGIRAGNHTLTLTYKLEGL